VSHWKAQVWKVAPVQGPSRPGGGGVAAAVMLARLECGMGVGSQAEGRQRPAQRSRAASQRTLPLKPASQVQRVLGP
jgi:hypothetical protein